MDSHESVTLITEMIGHAIDGHADRAATLLQQIGVASDPSEMYGMCCAIAEVGKAALTKFYGDRAPDPARGDMWAMQELQPGAAVDDPAKGFSMRFLVAYANGDGASTVALYNTALGASDDEYVSSVAALLADVAGIARLALKDAR
jgi:hypothetical protein